jgi:hypothetical protein
MLTHSTVCCAAQDMDRQGVKDDRYSCMCVMEALAADGLVSFAAAALYKHLLQTWHDPWKSAGLLGKGQDDNLP